MIQADCSTQNIFVIFHGGMRVRKKSHISLARYIIKKSNHQGLNKHKLLFCIGSILPDCKPSFLYKKHEITGTFDDVKHEIIRLSEKGEKNKNKFSYYINLGQVIHYVADYFTFPHNKIYPGGLSDHCSYEERLKKELREYLKNPEEEEGQKHLLKFENGEEINTFIWKTHEEYLKKKIDVEVDIQNIVRVNRQVVSAILSF